MNIRMARWLVTMDLVHASKALALVSMIAPPSCYNRSQYTSLRKIAKKYYSLQLPTKEFYPTVIFFIEMCFN